MPSSDKNIPDLIEHIRPKVRKNMYFQSELRSRIVAGYMVDRWYQKTLFRVTLPIIATSVFASYFLLSTPFLALITPPIETASPNDTMVISGNTLAQDVLDLTEGIDRTLLDTGSSLQSSMDSVATTLTDMPVVTSPVAKKTELVMPKMADTARIPASPEGEMSSTLAVPTMMMARSVMPEIRIPEYPEYLFVYSKEGIFTPDELITLSGSGLTPVLTLTETNQTVLKNALMQRGYTEGELVLMYSPARKKNEKTPKSYLVPVLRSGSISVPLVRGYILDL